MGRVCIKTKLDFGDALGRPMLIDEAEVLSYGFPEPGRNMYLAVKATF